MSAQPSQQDREAAHDAEYFVEYLRRLQKKMHCLHDIAVVDAEIDKFMEFTGRRSSSKSAA